MESTELVRETDLPLMVDLYELAMAHSFVQACASEMEAFETYARLYPGTALLVDTYDSQQAVK